MTKGDRDLNHPNITELIKHDTAHKQPNNFCVVWELQQPSIRCQRTLLMLNYGAGYVLLCCYMSIFRCDLENPKSMVYYCISPSRTPSVIHYISPCHIRFTITSTPYKALPLFDTRFTACAGGIRVSFMQPHLF